MNVDEKYLEKIVISPDEMNEALNTVIVAPLTSTLKDYPSRVNCVVKSKKGQIALDQIRTIDKIRIKNKLSVLKEQEQEEVFGILNEMFRK